MSRLMALAIRFEQLVRDGVVADSAELALLGHVSRAGVSQILPRLPKRSHKMNCLVIRPSLMAVLLHLIW